MMSYKNYLLIAACLFAVVAGGLATDEAVQEANPAVQDSSEPKVEETSPAAPVEEPAAPEEATAVQEEQSPANEQSGESYGAKIMSAVDQLSQQVKDDVEPMALNTWMDPHSHVQQKDLIQAVVEFIVTETQKPEEQRRYTEPNTFDDMIKVLIGDCQEVKQAFAGLDGVAYNEELNEEEVKWLVNARICSQLTNRNPNLMRVAEQEFENVNKASPAE